MVYFIGKSILSCYNIYYPSNPHMMGNLASAKSSLLAHLFLGLTTKKRAWLAAGPFAILNRISI